MKPYFTAAVAPSQQNVLVDINGAPLTNKKTDELLYVIVRAQNRIQEALADIFEAGKQLPAITNDPYQSSRVEVRDTMAGIYKTWGYIHEQVNFEYAQSVVLDVTSYKLPALGVFTLEYSQIPEGLSAPVIDFSDIPYDPDSSIVIASELYSTAFDPALPVADAESGAIDRVPSESNPAAQLIRTAKRELQTWLSCNSVELAHLLELSRQTLHDAENPARRPQARTAAKVLDIHAMLKAFIKEDQFARMAWLRGEGRELWNSRGLSEFMGVLEERLFPPLKESPVYSLSMAAEDEPEMLVKRDVRPYQGFKRRF